MITFPAKTPCSRRFGYPCLALYLPRRCGGLNFLTALSLFYKERRRLCILGRVRRIVVASHFMERELIRNGIDRASIEVVSLPLTGIAVAPHSEASPPTVLFLGRLTKVKGVDLLFDAVALLARGGRRIRVVVAGDGAERARLMRRAARLGIEAEFLGWVSTARRQELLQSAACLAMPSVWPEPFGLVGLEAVSAEVPVAAFDSGGIREWLVPGLNGEVALADPPTAAAFARALERALALRHTWESTREQRTKLLERSTPQNHFDRMESILTACARLG